MPTIPRKKEIMRHHLLDPCSLRHTGDDKKEKKSAIEIFNNRCFAFLIHLFFISDYSFSLSYRDRTSTLT